MEKSEERELESREKLVGTLLIFLMLTANIIILGVYFRVPLLYFYGFYEPDGYFHDAMIRAAVNNNFALPPYLGISGWPPTCNNYNCGPATVHHEPYGLYWTTLIPYFFLRFAGISYYDIQRLVPVFFAILDILGVYFLARYWSKDKFLGLLAMSFVALNMGNAARTSALIYRGDSFVTIYLIVALLFTIKIFREAERKRKLLYAILAAFFLSLANLTWNGAPFSTAIYIFSFVMILLFAFAFDKKKMVADSFYMLVILAIWYALTAVFKAFTWIAAVESFTGTNFFLLFIPMVACWYAVNFFVNQKEFYMVLMGNSLRRLAIAFITIGIVFLMIYLVIPSFVQEIFVTSGFLITSAFSSTIQELQAPTYNFLFASFNFENFANPMSLVMIAATNYGSNLTLLFWFLLVLLFIPYFFMHVEGTGTGLLSGRARLRFEFNETLLILISYFALTAYLQMNAIRFNSLLSIPLSLFSAYTIYWLVLLLKRFRLAFYASLLLVLLLLMFIVQTDAGYITTLAPADQINPQFIQAMAWLKNNSAPNSVVLTLWPDGSVVEGVANRTSITDSVGSQYAFKANPFAAWLYNSSPDPGFLLSKINGKPDYLLVRGSWLTETGGIFTESGLNTSPNAYGFNLFTSLNERSNATTQIFEFLGSGLDEFTVITNSSGNQVISSYLKIGNGIQPFEYIDFYNELTGDYVIIKQTGFNVTNNQTFLIEYSPLPAPGLHVNITAAYMLNTRLAASNMIQFLFHCGPKACTWDNNVASLKLVHLNADSKIFQIVYNESNASVKAATLAYPR